MTGGSGEDVTSRERPRVQCLGEWTSSDGGMADRCHYPDCLGNASQGKRCLGGKHVQDK